MAQIELTTILVPDEKTGFFSAFFAQFPEAIAQGENEDDAQVNLLRIFSVMLRDKKEEVIKQIEPKLNYTERTLNLISA